MRKPRPTLEGRTGPCARSMNEQLAQADRPVLGPESLDAGGMELVDLQYRLLSNHAAEDGYLGGVGPAIGDHDVVTILHPHEVVDLADAHLRGLEDPADVLVEQQVTPVVSDDDDLATRESPLRKAQPTSPAHVDERRAEEADQVLHVTLL